MSERFKHDRETHPAHLPGERAVELGVALWDGEERLLSASPTLWTLAAPYGSPQIWWRHVLSLFSPPFVGNCPQCGFPQHVGTRLISLEENGAERIFELSFAGHGHDLVDRPADVVMVREVTSRESLLRGLKDTVKQFRSICENIQDVYYRTDPEGTLLFISPSCRKLIAYQPEELSNRPFVDLCVDPSYWQELLEVLETTATVQDFDIILLCKAGRQVPVSLNARKIFSDTGKLVAIEGILRDATERNQLDAMLMERNQKLQETMAELEHQKFALDQHAIVSISDSSGRIIYANKKLIEISQYSLEELKGETHRIINSGYHPKSFFKEMWRTIASGQVWRGQIRNRRKDGQFYWVDCTIVPFMTPAGEPYQYVSISTDISERIQAEKRLDLSRNFLLSITNAMGEGIYALDRQGRLTFLNQEAERLLGWREGELVNKKLHDVIHFQKADGTPLPAEECPVHRSILGRSFRVEEDVFTRKNGEIFPVSYVTAPLIEDGEIAGSVAVFRDITDRKRVEEELRQARDMALETSRLKSEFLANMSHEIRTPMNAIIGMTDLLMDTPLNEEQFDFSEIVRDSAQSLLSIINDILDFSKIEAGKIDIEEMDFSLLKVVEGTAELLAPQAHVKHLSFMTCVSPEIPRILRGDPGRVRQMLVNLAGNAIKFTEDGEVVVRAMVRERDGNRVMVHFSVRDTGCGLSPSARKRLFKPFTQADGATTRKYGGTGLGLAICNRLVELMGGQVGVESKEGEGSVFWFTIPFRVPDLDLREDPGEWERLKGLRVLVVVERSTDLDILTSGVNALGLESEAAGDGKQALRRLRRAFAEDRPFHMAVVGAQLPDMTGLAFAREALLAGGPSLKLLGLLDFPDKDWEEEAIAAGFSGKITKPIRQGDLLEGIAALFYPKADTESAETPPVAPSRDAPVLPAPDAYDALESGKLLLLAEDNPVNRKVALMQLKRLGFAAHAVGNGKEAVEAYTHLPYALILMDCQMPVMDGFEATQLIRKLEAATARHIPIIAMTANAMKGDRERCLRAGMDDYLSKPVSPDELKARLEQWIPRRSGTLPPVEIQQLRQLFGNDDGEIRHVLKEFLEAADVSHQRVAQRIADRDEAGLLEAVLEFKGACANIGASGMVQLLHRIELFAPGALDWEEAQATVEALRRAIFRVEAFVRQY